MGHYYDNICVNSFSNPELNGTYAYDSGDDTLYNTVYRSITNPANYLFQRTEYTPGLYSWVLSSSDGGKYVRNPPYGGADGAVGTFQQYYPNDQHGTATTESGTCDVAQSSSSSSSYIKNWSSSSLSRSESSSTEDYHIFMRGIGASGSCTSDPIVVVKPNGLQEGDFMIAQIFFNGNVDPLEGTKPTGWTAWTTDNPYMIYGYSYGTYGTCGVWYKVATASDVAAASFTWTKSGTNGIGRIIAFGGVDTSVGIEITGSTLGTTSLSPLTISSIDPSYKWDMMVFLGCGIKTGATVSPSFSSWAIATSGPTFTEAWDLGCTDFNWGSGIGCAYGNRYSDDATGNVTVSITNGTRGSGIIFGLKEVGENSSSSSSPSSTSSMSSDSSVSTQSSSSSVWINQSSSSSENVFEPIGYLCVEINGSDTKNHYIPLYYHYTPGHTASDRDFWGDIVVSPTNLVEDGFISNVVNGFTKWLHVYTADSSASCCTNLEGVYRSVI